MGTEQNADVDMDRFELHFLEALSDDSVIKKYQEILTPWLPHSNKHCIPHKLKSTS